jgi:cytochrome c-type biogenesis protein CcsB
MSGVAQNLISTQLLNWTGLLYFFSMFTFVILLAVQNKKIGTIASLFAYAGLALHTVSIGLRWVESYNLGYGHAPLSNMYESIIFFSWTIVLIFLLIDLKYKYKIVGVFVMPFALFSLAWAQMFSVASIVGSSALSKLVIMDDKISPLMPALQSNWLLYHVITCFLGYAAFAVACGVSIMYLIKANFEKPDKDKSAGGILAVFPPIKVLDDMNYRAIMVGFPLLTLGIITGAAWANYAWGSYWSWDPKETWSLIVWFVYAAFLHARFTRGWVGKRAAWLSIIGFASTLFCYLGVNLLLSGLHSYGGKM